MIKQTEFYNKVGELNYKSVLLLSDDKYNYYLEPPSWNCNWYWGWGYLSGYPKDKPIIPKYQVSHTHLKGLSLEQFDEQLIEKYKKHKWILLELIKTFYVLRDFSDFTNSGGRHITANPLENLLKDEELYKEINLVKIPKVFEEFYKVLSDE